jgi:N6-L-threonylcarbamoyladenine synthase
MDDPKPQDPPKFPLLALLVSGGHTELNLISDHLVYRRLGSTLDDAAGEAFDKVARLLGLPYPGGPSIQKAAVGGNPEAFAFPRARLDGTWNFSFSGLKTAVLRVVRQFEHETRPLPVEDLAASFQAAVVDVLLKKTLKAAQSFKVKEIVLAGGVSANKALREAFLAQTQYHVHIPNLALCTDNAAMIGAAGFYRFSMGQRDALDLDVLPTWPLS